MSNAPVRGDAAGAPLPSTPATARAVPLSTKIANLVIAVVLIAVAAAAIAATRDFPKSMLPADVGAARFPLIHAGILILLCLILIADTLRTPTRAPGRSAAEDAPPVGAAGYVAVALGILATAACLWAMEQVGYVLSTVVYMASLMWLMGQRSPLWNPLLSVGITAVIYAAFEYLLLVPLPVGSLFE